MTTPKAEGINNEKPVGQYDLLDKIRNLSGKIKEYKERVNDYSGETELVLGKLSIEVNNHEDDAPAYGLPGERTKITRFDCILKNTEDESKKFTIETFLNDRGGFGVSLIGADNSRHYGIGSDDNPQSPEQVIAQSLMKKLNAIEAEMKKNVEMYENQNKKKIQETAAQTAAKIDALNI